MRIRRKTSYGWEIVLESEVEGYIAQAAKYNNLSGEEVEKKLDVAQVQYGTGLYYEPVYIVSDKLYEDDKKREAERQKKIVFVNCSCGHTIPKSQVMSASLGNSCPDCYDRMS